MDVTVRFSLIGQKRPKPPQPSDPDYSVGAFREFYPERIGKDHQLYLKMENEHREYCDRESQWTDSIRGGGRWVCTRKKGHSGDHMAHQKDEFAVARWP